MLIYCPKMHIYCPKTLIYCANWHIYSIFSHILWRHRKPFCPAEKCCTGHYMRRSIVWCCLLGIVYGALCRGLPHWSCYTALLHLMLETWHAIPPYHFHLFAFIIYIFLLYQKYVYFSTVLVVQNIWWYYIYFTQPTFKTIRFLLAVEFSPRQDISLANHSRLLIM